MDLIQRMPDVFHEAITSRLGFCDLLSLAAVDTTCRDEVRSVDECDRSLARHAIQKHIQKHSQKHGHRHNRRVRLHVNVPVAWL